MKYYHCSPIGGLKILKPQKPDYFDKPALVYMTTLLPMALLYSAKNFEYTYGYTKDKKIYYEEYYPNSLEEIYKGKMAYLYECEADEVSETKIPNEVISKKEVKVVREIFIPDAYEAILEQEKAGTIKIIRYEELSEERLAWIKCSEAEAIREMNLIDNPSPMADYLKKHYPESWEMCLKEKQK